MLFLDMALGLRHGELAGLKSEDNQGLTERMEKQTTDG